MISQYLKERVKWKKFDKPIRTQRAIDELFIICNDCENYQKVDEVHGSCSICKCGIKKTGAFLNKLAWGTTRCPLEEPKWKESHKRYQIDINVTSEQLYEAEEDHKKELIVREARSNPPVKRCCGG